MIRIELDHPFAFGQGAAIHVPEVDAALEDEVQVIASTGEVRFGVIDEVQFRREAYRRLLFLRRHRVRRFVRIRVLGDHGVGVAK